MFPRLLNNIAITAVAYAVISGVGLLLAPFLIATYGLGGYGQILLARVFLPSAFIGLLDLGIGETATRSVSHADSTGDWAEGSATLSLLALIAVGVSAAVGVAIALLAHPIARWLAIAPAEADGFVMVLRLTAALQPFLFLSLVAEGAIKGLEKFKVLRTCEVVAAVLQGVLAIALGLAGFGPNWVAASLLLSLLVRFTMMSTAAYTMLRRHAVTWRRWTPALRHEVIGWSRIMLGSKLLGTIQNQIASPIIGLVFGPAAVGAYDAVVRLPRFAKTAFSLISTTVLPTATGLRSSGDRARLASLGYYGILGAFVVCAPFALFALVFSEPILGLWIGPQVASFWPWQSAMFVVALLNVPISFGGAILLAERGGSQQLLRLTALQVALQLAGALALLHALGAWAFVLAQTTSVMLVFFAQLALIRRTLDLPARLLGNLARIVLLSTAVAVALLLAHRPDTWIELAAELSVGLGIVAAITPWLLFDPGERTALLGLWARLRVLKAVDGPGATH